MVKLIAINKKRRSYAVFVGSNHMKKFFGILLSAVMCTAVLTAFVGCSDKGSKNETTTKVGAVYEIEKDEDDNEYAVLKQYTISDTDAAKVAKNNYSDIMVDLEINEYTVNEGTDQAKTYPVKEIAASALANQPVIRSVKFGSNVETFGAACLAGCINLKSLTVPFVGKTVNAVNDGKVLGFLFGTASVDGATAVTMNYNATGTKTFYIPNALKEVTVTGTELSDYAFYGLPVEKINAENVKTIGRYAFYGMTNLTSYAISAGVTAIGDYAFAKCPNLSVVGFAAATSLKTIGAHAFDGCDILGYGKNNAVTLPASLETLGEKAFYNCTELTAVDLSASKVTTINDYTFYGCKKLASVKLKANTTIKLGVFVGCDVITEAFRNGEEDEVIENIGSATYTGEAFEISIEA